MNRVGLSFLVIGICVVLTIIAYFLVYEFWVMGEVHDCKFNCYHPTVVDRMVLPYGYYNPTTLNGNIYGAKYSTCSSMADLTTCVIGKHEFFRWFDNEGKPTSKLFKIKAGKDHVGDIRLFEWRGDIRGVGTNGKRPVLVKFPRTENENIEISIIDYTNPNNRDKNWTPLIQENNLYLHTDTTKDKIIFRMYEPETNFAHRDREIEWIPPDDSTWRGGTNWIEVNNGIFWGILHNNVERVLRRRIYRSILVEIDWHKRQSRRTDILCFDERDHAPIQFVVGIHHTDNDTIGVSFGRNDRRAITQYYRKEEIRQRLMGSTSTNSLSTEVITRSSKSTKTCES